MGDQLQQKGCCDKREEEGEDRISKLGDDVLISILSRLSFREATATSILSPRWQSLYTHHTRLDLPPFKPEPSPVGHIYECEITRGMFNSYKSMINRLLASHKAAEIQEFRVRLPCLKGAGIQRWLEFALSRKVETLEISMCPVANDLRRDICPFRLSKNKGPSRVLAGLRCLKDLSLVDVAVDNEAVETLLSDNSTLLESLSIVSCNTLTRVSVVGSPRLLKHLGFSFCGRLESIEIRDMMELVSLRCYRNESPDVPVVRLSNVPKLVELDTSDNQSSTDDQNLPPIPSAILDQLRLLKLLSSASRLPYFFSPENPGLVNVKHVEVKVHLRWGIDLSHVTLLPLLVACRSLEELHVELLDESRRKHDDLVFSKTHYFQRKSLSPQLRKLTLSNYSATPTEERLALRLLSCIHALQELVVSTSNQLNQKQQLRAQRQFLTTTVVDLQSVKISFCSS